MKHCGRGVTGLLYAWCLCVSPCGAAVRLDSAGLSADLVEPRVAARLTLTELGRFRVRLGIEATGVTTPFEVSVEVAQSGQRTWPADELWVSNEADQPVPIRRGGDEWHRFRLTVPAAGGTYLVRAEPTPGPKLLPEAARTASDAGTGLRVSIANWHGDRAAALCLRFDDSTPSHLTAAMPLLDQYGFRATFLVNPGRPGFTEHQREWDEAVRQGRHEFGNHSWSHRGARTEAEIAQELGEVSEYLWSRAPDRSRLLVLVRGGGTIWTTTGPFRPHLERYHLVSITGSLGLDDVYGRRVEALRQHLARAIQNGGWAKAHWHTVGDDQATSRENFVAELDAIKAVADQLWITGLADAWRYLRERRTSSLSLTSGGPQQFRLSVTCGTEAVLYDQPLTLRVELPAGRTKSTLRNATVQLPLLKQDGSRCWWDVPPVTGTYTLKLE